MLPVGSPINVSPFTKVTIIIMPADFPNLSSVSKETFAYWRRSLEIEILFSDVTVRMLTTRFLLICNFFTDVKCCRKDFFWFCDFLGRCNYLQELSIDSVSLFSLCNYLQELSIDSVTFFILCNYLQEMSIDSVTFFSLCNHLQK